MRIFKNTWFTRFAGKEGITDGELREAVNQLEAGHRRQRVGGDSLGGGVYKIRLARPGEGKSGGYRVIVFFRSEERTFYQYAYPKSSRSNIGQGELRFYKKLAKLRFAMSDRELADALNAGEFIEI
jgi:hypothetical protein